MTWTWVDTRWILAAPEGRQLDLEIAPHRVQLWYRRTGAFPRSLLVGVYHTVDEAKQAGYDLLAQLSHSVNMFTDDERTQSCLD